jgi:Flp pilus assembly protein TadD
MTAPGRRAISPVVARHAPAAILVLIGLALYGYTLPFPFVFDDHIYLVNNPLATDARSFRYPFEFHDFANRATSLGLQVDLSTNFILRPFAYLTFYLNYLAGGLQPPGFRAVNILIHCANAVLLLALVRRLLLHAQPVPAPASSAPFIAMCAALLFLVHPLQIESVTYVIQRFTSLGVFFYLATVLLFVASRTAVEEKITRRCRRWSLASMALGICTKEFLFTAPFLMVALDCVVLRAPLREALRRIVPWALFLPIVPVLMGLTAAAQSGAANFTTWLNVAGQDSPDPSYPLYYALTQPGVIVGYLRRMFLPYGLNIDPELPPVTSPWQWRFLAPVAFLIALLGVSWAWWRRQPDDPLRRVGFVFVLWLFLGFSIDSSIVPLPDLISEHRSYLSTIGCFGAVACLAGAVRMRLPPALRWLPPAVLGVWAIGLTAATVERHEKWRSNLAIWSDAAAKSPAKPRVWANLGTALARDGQNARAAEAFARIIALDPRNVHAHYKLVQVEMRLGRMREAIALAEAGLRIDPRAAPLHQLAAECHMHRREYGHAIRSLDAALALRPAEWWTHLAAADVHARLGNFARARQHCEAAREIGLHTDAQRRWLQSTETMLPPGTASR